MNSTSLSPPPKLETVSDLTTVLVIHTGDHQAVPFAGLREMLLPLADGRHLLVTSPPEPKPD